MLKLAACIRKKFSSRIKINSYLFLYSYSMTFFIYITITTLKKIFFIVGRYRKMCTIPNVIIFQVMRNEKDQFGQWTLKCIKRKA